MSFKTNGEFEENPEKPGTGWYQIVNDDGSHRGWLPYVTLTEEQFKQCLIDDHKRDIEHTQDSNRSMIEHMARVIGSTYYDIKEAIGKLDQPPTEWRDVHNAKGQRPEDIEWAEKAKSFGLIPGHTHCCMRNTAWIQFRKLVTSLDEKAEQFFPYPSGPRTNQYYFVCDQRRKWVMDRLKEANPDWWKYQPPRDT